MIKGEIRILVLLIFTLIKISSCDTDTLKKRFHCANNRYIYDKWFCDGANDCGDGSDESYGCDEGICGKGNFTCKSSHCIPIADRCNKISDCADGSDELFCDHEFDLRECTTYDGKYLCKDKLRCIDLAYVCDGSSNCFDGSDENENCSVTDTDVCISCPHACFRTPNGPQCFCNSSNYEYLNLCKEMKACQFSYEECDQKCVQFQRVEQCTCGENYKMLKDVCVSNVSNENVLFYSTGTEIKKLNLTSNKTTTQHYNLEVTAMTAAHGFLYWAGTVFGMEKIIKTSMTKANNVESHVICQTDLNNVNSIAVDWITGNVYFTTRLSLSVCSNEGKICVELKSLTFGTGYVGLAPRYGLMFWSLNTENKYVRSCIIKAAMDGSNEHVFIHRNLRYAASLTVDEQSERIYWLDTELRKIESVQFDGNNREVVLSDVRKHFYSLTVFENEIYWTLEFNNTIFRRNIKFGRMNSIVENSTGPVRHIFAYNPLLQRTKIVNPCISSCSGLCLLRPTSTKRLNYTCICQHIKLSDEEQWCFNDDYVKFELQTEESMYNAETIILNEISPAVSTDNKKPMVIFVMVLMLGLIAVGIYVAFQKWKQSSDGERDNIIE